MDRPPLLRETFDAFVDAAKRNGAVSLRPVKTRIALQTFSRFASVTVRGTFLACHVVLDHGNARRHIQKIEKVGTSYVHSFTLSKPADVDAGICELLKEAQEIDRRRHGRRSQEA
jgi:uncharacterized protein DUF5655